MNARLVSLLVAVTATSCGNPSLSGDRDAGPVSVGNDLSMTPSGGDMAMQPQPPGSFSVNIGPINLNPGEETVVCSTVRIPTTADTDVVRMQTTLRPGSHHLILYLSADTIESPMPTPCGSFDGVTMGQQPLFIAESASSTMVMPSEAAYHFPAGQMVHLEAHYINTTQSPLMGQGTVELTAGDPTKSYQPIGMMFCGSVLALAAPGLAPNQQTTLPVGFYAGGSSVDLTKLKVFAFTSHEHHLGTDVKIWKGTQANHTATQLFDNPSWDNPPLQLYSDSNLLTFAAGEGLAWQCTYDNTTSSTVSFGESANNEMCFIWAYYYPSIGRFISMGDCWQ
jgi:hypothetical protein